MIKHEINDVPGSINGWLQPDHTVKLRVRDGSAVSLPNRSALTTRP